MSVVRSQPSPKRVGDGKSWVTGEEETEASIIGSHFANAIAIIAMGKAETLKEKKKKPKSFRTIFYEEDRYNPPLNQAHITSAFEAHEVDDKLSWNKKGLTFKTGNREFKPPFGDKGPTHPEEYPLIFEKPIKTFGRTREVRPLSRVAKTPQYPVIKRRFEESKISPMTYLLPDLWKSEEIESSSFRSSVDRFKIPQDLSLTHIPSRSHILTSKKKSTHNSPLPSRPSTTSPIQPHSRSNSPPHSRGKDQSILDIGQYSSWSSNELLSQHNKQPSVVISSVVSPSHLRPITSPTKVKSPTNKIMPRSNSAASIVRAKTPGFSFSHGKNESLWSVYDEASTLENKDSVLSFRKKNSTSSIPVSADKALFDELEKTLNDQIKPISRSGSRPESKLTSGYDLENDLLKTPSTENKHFSHHEVIVSRWAPPMCYSKKKPFDDLFSNESRPTSKALKKPPIDYFNYDPNQISREVNPKSREEEKRLDKNISMRTIQRFRPKTSA